MARTHHGRKLNFRKLPRPERCGPTGKVRFNTHAAALSRACEILAEVPSDCCGFRAYLCDRCGGYHLTSHL